MEQVVGLDGCAITCVHPDRVRMVREAAPREEALTRVTGLFKLLGDPTRSRLLYALLEAGEMCVCDLAAATDTAEATVSQALRLLRTAGVVAGRRDGVVAHCVALMTGVQTEDPLDPALTASVGQRARQLPDDGLEAHRRCPARLPQLLDLVSVLDQAEFT